MIFDPQYRKPGLITYESGFGAENPPQSTVLIPYSFRETEARCLQRRYLLAHILCARIQTNYTISANA